MLTRHLTSELQYNLAIFMWMLFLKSLRLPREKHFELQKVVPDPGVLMVLTSESLSGHSVVQILRIWTSKSRPNMPAFYDFDFRIALAPQRGANFGNILGSRSSAPACFWELTFRNYGKHSISRNSYPPKPLHLTHLSCITSARSHLLVDRSSAATLRIVGS